MNDNFNQFLENIMLTSNQREDAKKKYDGVCAKLHDHYYTTKYSGCTKLLIGSYGKKTNIRPARDIDVIFIMPPDKYDQYADNQSNGQSQLLQDIKRILEEKYHDTPIKAFGKVVVIEFSDTQHQVELLPAWENDDGTFTIANSENGGSWEHWDPRSEIKKIKDSNGRTGRTRFLIRMVKKWTENCTAKIKSYQIENRVVDYFATNTFSEKEYPALVHDFFDYFHQIASDQELKSHLETALNRSKKACEFEDNGELDNAAGEWRKIFGDDFPASVAKSISASDSIKPTLADYSHVEPLKWKYVGNNKVRIDAYVYDDQKTKKFGGINSDGRNISSGFCLKYVADTDIVGMFQYYWQVVNTGQEAVTANDLRGSLFLGDQVRWEHTKYKGKHWIECFIVQNGTCVARSGKFFININ